MTRIKRETISYFGKAIIDPETGEIKVPIITYKRRKPKPTLNQFALRKNFGKRAKDTKGIKGVTYVGNRLIPNSAKAMQDITGIISDKLITPEIIQEYHKKHGSKKKTKGPRKP